MRLGTFLASVGFREHLRNRISVADTVRLHLCISSAGSPSSFSRLSALQVGSRSTIICNDLHWLFHVFPQKIKVVLTYFIPFSIDHDQGRQSYHVPECLETRPCRCCNSIHRTSAFPTFPSWRRASTWRAVNLKRWSFRKARIITREAT